MRIKKSPKKSQEKKEKYLYVVVNENNQPIFNSWFNCCYIFTNQKSAEISIKNQEEQCKTWGNITCRKRIIKKISFIKLSKLYEQKQEKS